METGERSDKTSHQVKWNKMWREIGNDADTEVTRAFNVKECCCLVGYGSFRRVYGLCSSVLVCLC